MPSKWEILSRYTGLLSTIFAIVTFFFPDVPDEVRYALLGITLVSVLYLAVRPYFPLDRFRIAYEANAYIYGYKYEKLELSAIMAEDGSAVLVRKVRAVAASSELDAVHHYLMVPGSKEGGQLLPSPTARVTSWDDQLRRLSLEQVRSPEGYNSFKINIDPPLGKGGQIEYAVEETAPPGTFATTTDELPTDTPYEWFAWEISRPTKELLLELSIPLTLGTHTHHADVWRGTEYGHSTFVPEFDRVASGWQETTRTLKGKDYLVLSLRVSYPILGMRYVIKWTPMTVPQQQPL